MGWGKARNATGAVISVEPGTGAVRAMVSGAGFEGEKFNVTTQGVGRSGGSTFKNPDGHKAWALIDAAGCRGLRRGDAQVSEKHCNFLLNLGSATSAEIEALGEEVRAKVLAHSGVDLEWEIQRVGVAR